MLSKMIVSVCTVFQAQNMNMQMCLLCAFDYLCHFNDTFIKLNTTEDIPT